MLKLLFIMLLFAFSTLIPNDVVVLLIPIITWLATALVNLLKSWLANSTGGFGGTILVGVVVPAISLLSAWLIKLSSNTELDFWILVLIGFVGTFLNELLKQLKQTWDKGQTKANSKFIG